MTIKKWQVLDEYFLVNPDDEDDCVSSKGLLMRAEDVNELLQKIAQNIRYYLKHQNIPPWTFMSEYEKGVYVTCENMEDIVLKESIK